MGRVHFVHTASRFVQGKIGFGGGGGVGGGVEGGKRDKILKLLGLARRAVCVGRKEYVNSRLLISPWH